MFPEYRANDFYMFGESYGGKYVIALAHAINSTNSAINLKGIAMGNAWVAPILQERIYGTLGYVTGILSYSHLVNINSYESFTRYILIYFRMVSQCHGLVEREEYYQADKRVCAPMWLETIRAGGGFNAYDYRLLGRYPFMPEMTAYMRRPDLMAALGVPANRVPEDTCNYQLFDQFLIEFQKDYTDMIPSLLTKYRILVYVVTQVVVVMTFWPGIMDNLI